MRPIVVAVTGVGSTSLVRFYEYANAQVSIQCVLNGTATYSVQVSNDDPNSYTNPVAVGSMTWSPSPDALAVGATTSIFTALPNAPTFARVTITTGTGTVTSTFVQAGVAPY